MSILGTRAGTAPRAAVRPVEPLPDVLGPDLPGAACKGHGGLFDDWVEHRAPSGRFRPETPTERAERHEQAILICETRCPVQAECLQARLNDPKLGHGVWAGRVFSSYIPDRVCACGMTFRPNAHNHTRCVTCQQTPPRPPRETRTCPCGAVFHPSGAQTICKDCPRTPQRVPALPARVCARTDCGRPFQPHQRGQRFCDPACQRKAGSQLQEARRKQQRREAREMAA